MPNNEPRDKGLFVPTPSKQVKKDTPISLLKEAVTAFNKFASKDPLNGMAEWLQEENEKNREHEKRMMEMQMQIFQTMIATFSNQEQEPMTPQHQIPFASQMQPTRHEDEYFIYSFVDIFLCKSFLTHDENFMAKFFNLLFS